MFTENRNNINVPIVFSTDHGYIMPTAVAILSMLEHSKDVFVQILILQAESVTEEDRNKLSKIVADFNASITFVTVENNIFGDSYEIRGITTATYYRLLIPWLFPDLDKVIYIDGDVLFRKSVNLLYQIDLGENYLGAMKSVDIEPDAFCRYAFKIGCDYREYINAGVLLINSKKQREDNLKPIFLKHSSKKYNYQDQDILNIVCKGKIQFIDTIFNTRLLSSCIPNDVCIVHYSGEKPWKVFVYGWRNWWNEYKKTDFFDPSLISKLEENTLSKKLTKRELFLTLSREILLPFYNKIVRYFYK